VSRRNGDRTDFESIESESFDIANASVHCGPRRPSADRVLQRRIEAVHRRRKEQGIDDWREQWCADAKAPRGSGALDDGRDRERTVIRLANNRDEHGG